MAGRSSLPLEVNKINGFPSANKARNKYAHVTPRIDTGIRKQLKFKESGPGRVEEVTRRSQYREVAVKACEAPKQQRGVVKGVRRSVHGVTMKSPVRNVPKHHQNVPGNVKKFQKKSPQEKCHGQRLVGNQNKVTHNIGIHDKTLPEVNPQRTQESRAANLESTFASSSLSSIATLSRADSSLRSDHVFFLFVEDADDDITNEDEPWLREDDLVSSITSFAGLSPLKNINSKYWKKCAAHVLARRGTTWRRECEARIPAKHLQECLDREPKDRITLEDDYMVIYMKWHAFQDIPRRVTFRMFESRSRKALVQSVVRGGSVTTLLHEPDGFLYVENALQEVALDVSSFEVGDSHLYYVYQDNVWRLSLFERGVPAKVYEASSTLRSFSVFDEELHCVVNDPLALDISPMTLPCKKVTFYMGASYARSVQRSVFKICGKGVIVGMYLEHGSLDNVIFEVFMLQDKEMRSVYCQQVAQVFDSYITYFFCYGQTFLVGLQSGVVVMYHVPTWVSFNLAKYDRMFTGLQGYIHRIYVEEGEFERIFVIETSCKVYSILASVCD